MLDCRDFARALCDIIQNFKVALGVMDYHSEICQRNWLTSGMYDRGKVSRSVIGGIVGAIYLLVLM